VIAISDDKESKTQVEETSTMQEKEKESENHMVGK
jgi:hypothetical protein